MLKITLVVLFLVIPEFSADCLAATDPHLPPSGRVRTTTARRDSSTEDDGWNNAHTKIEREADLHCRCCGLIGGSQPIREILEMCHRVADTDLTVLISGETGTGKDLLARCIHMHSRRAARRFMPVACAALPEALLESQLFGHKRGSFTGAVSDQRGLIERAAGGTLFLDEIDALHLPMQAKLLRVVEEHSIQQVGGGHDVPVDFRLITATNTDLKSCVDAGTFRSDLFYRLNVVHIQIPPLRDRIEDIPLLALYFRDAFAREAGLPVLPFAESCLEWLVSRDWPGNIRQLKHAVERATVLSAGRDRIMTDDLWSGSSLCRENCGSMLARPLARGWTLRELEDQYTRAVLTHVGGHKGRAAQFLGIDRRTLYRRLSDLEEESEA